ncbi:MAG: type 4a pilus biogenesis protein PilO [Nitrospirae bacterium]|nr:type 4a pilus biogenesis protein PilO [Nitrospirota bacterium]
MAMNLKLDFSTMPGAVKAALSLAPAVVISVLAVIFLLLPRQKEIKRLSAEITKQENQIAADQVKAAKLVTLRVENEKLKKRLEELKLQLPEEKEVTGLLKQVSDLGIKAGLKIISWKPESKKDHPSGIIYEIPVAVQLSGSYHNLAVFFSNLTKLNRIVNISDIKIGDAKPERNEATLKITFKATTFSTIPESEVEAKAKAATVKGKKKK